MSRPEVLAGAHTLTRQVENTLFRFHAYHLQRSTTYFDDLLAMTPPPPLEDDDAGDCSISLDDVKVSDFHVADMLMKTRKRQFKETVVFEVTKVSACHSAQRMARHIQDTCHTQDEHKEYAFY